MLVAMRTIASRCLGEHPDIDVGRNLAPVSLQAEPRFLFADGAISQLGGALQTVRTRAVGLPSDARLLAATEDLVGFVATNGQQLLLGESSEIHGKDIREADSASFVGSHRILVTAPRMASSTWQGRPRESSGPHGAYLINRVDRSVIAEAALDVDAVGVTAVRHPHDGSVLLDAGMGQDGSRIFRARSDGDQLIADLILEDVVAAGFDPSGSRLLLTPHLGTNAALLEWPSLRRIAELSPEDAGLDEDDMIDLYGCFVGDDRILLKTVKSGIVLCDRSLAPLGRLALDDPLIGGKEIESIWGLSEETFAVRTWRVRTGTTSVWTIALV